MWRSYIWATKVSRTHLFRPKCSGVHRGWRREGDGGRGMLPPLLLLLSVGIVAAALLQFCSFLYFLCLFCRVVVCVFLSPVASCQQQQLPLSLTLPLSHSPTTYATHSTVWHFEKFSWFFILLLHSTKDIFLCSCFCHVCVCECVVCIACVCVLCVYCVLCVLCLVPFCALFVSAIVNTLLSHVSLSTIPPQRPLLPPVTPPLNHPLSPHIVSVLGANCTFVRANDRNNTKSKTFLPTRAPANLSNLAFHFA